MKTKLVLMAASALSLSIVGSAIAAEPADIVISQASVGALVKHQVVNDPNLFVAYFHPASYAYIDREQFNVDIWNNMGGWQWASAYAIAYENDTPPFHVLGGAEWTTNEQVHIDNKTQTPIFLAFDASYGSDYVFVVDRALTDLAVHVAGDVDGDGDVTTEDANLVAAVSAGLGELTRIQSAVADVNCDNEVDILDALKIARFAAGLEAPGCN